MKYKNKKKLFLIYGLTTNIIIVILINIKITKFHLFFYENHISLKTTITNSNSSDLINNYLSMIPEKYNKSKIEEKERLTKFLALKDLPSDPQLILEIKNNLLKEFSKAANKNLTSMDTIFVTGQGNFGNSLVSLNNMIFYCEILGCKNILLNSQYSHKTWHLKNKIIYNTTNTNLVIMQHPPINCNEPNVMCTFLGDSYYYPMVVKVQIRVNIFKSELLKNLPKVETDPNDLYIHIRSGDIFSFYIHSLYSQPPLCFYKKIINNYKFRKIYIIAENKANFVIDELLNEFKNITYTTNKIDVDISYLIYAYNIVASVSSFFTNIIKFNDNLKNMWEYDIYRMSEKFSQLHHDFFKYPIKYNIYTMKPSDLYRREMFKWKNSEEQLKLMKEENCPYDFIINK